MKREPECLLCKMKYQMPFVETPVFPAMRMMGQTVYLCEFHEKYLNRWSQPEEREEMLSMIASRLKREKM